MDRTELARRFGHHPTVTADIPKYVKIRTAAMALAETITDVCPDGREQSLALTKLEETMNWAILAISNQNPAD